MIKVMESVYMNDVQIITVDEVIEGLNGNMPQSRIDKELAHLRRIVNKLRCVSYSTCHVLVDPEMTYDPRFVDRDADESIDDSAYLTRVYGIKMAYDNKNNIGYYYFSSEEDANKYLKIYDQSIYD